MDTEFVVLAEQFNLDKVLTPSLDEAERKTFIFYVEVTRHLQEIEQLFQIYRFNFCSIFHYYKLYSNGKFERNELFEFTENNFAAINALTINIVSAGKTLVDSIDTYMTSVFGEETDIYLRFKKDILAKKYDKHFPYRFLLRLRDFAQHGHPPVSVNLAESRCCFDLTQILNTPHFSHNTKLKNELESIKNEIAEKARDNPKIAFVFTMARYNLCITEIYDSFFKIIKKRTFKLYNQVMEIASNRLDMGETLNEEACKFVAYAEVDGCQHMFDINADFSKMFAGFQKFADETLKQERLEAGKLFEHIKKKPL